VKRRGTMTGIVLTGIGLGTLVMTPVSNWLISIFDWRLSYIIVGGMVMLIGITASQFLRGDPARMGLVPYGKTEVKEQELAGVAQGFSLREATHTRQFWMVSVIFFCLGYCIFAINVHLVPHITDLEISATTAANIMATTGALQTIGGIVLGGAADRIGNRQVLVISFIMITVAMLFLVLFTGVYLFYLFAVIYGFAVGGGGAMEPTIVAELFGMKAHGLILGVMSFVFTVGGAIGPLVTGYIFDVNGSYHSAFLVCAAFSAIGLILAAVSRPIKRPG
jgi:MFS family permease